MSSFLSYCLLLPLIPASATALTPGQAYHAATQFLRAEGVSAFAASEAQAVLLGEALGGDPLASGPRSTALLASLELVSVDARARRARTLGALMLAVGADASAVRAARTPSLGFGVAAGFLPTALDTALALQALDAANLGATLDASQAAADLCAGAPVAPTGGLWPLLRNPSDAPAVGDVATTAQAVLALKPRQASCPAQFSAAVAALAAQPPPTLSASGRALRVLALVEAAHATAEAELGTLASSQNTDGSFGAEPLSEDRVYATALAARAILRAGQLGFPLDSDGDGTADGPDKDSDNDGVCDQNETGAGCTGSDAFPTDPAESADLDLDGVGNDADDDDDGDGIADASEPGFGTVAQEHANTDGDAFADTADTDDDNDGVFDVEELLAGLDPLDFDTDGDSFRDNVELAKGKDPLDAADYPRPDGDVFPVGAPDGLVDARDELLAHRVLRGLVTVPSGAQTVFFRHADVAPLVAGVPAPNGGAFDAGDVLVITRRVRGMVAVW